MRGILLWGRRVLLVAFAAAASGASGQELVTDFKAAPGNGAYSFASNSPASLPVLLRSPASGEAASIVGHLFLPAGTGKVPVVVLLHGSGGIYNAMLDYWPKLLNAQGIGVFALDRFGPRGVKSTAEDQSQIPFAADVQDAFNALRLLATHPRVDAGKIAAMGFSRGGIASWRVAVERIIAAQKLPDGLRFAAHVQQYSGGCAGAFRLIVKPGAFSKAPQLWVHGDADDYTPIGSCQDYAKKIGEAGTPVEFITLPGAHHKFDQDDQRRFVVREAQKTLDNCPVETDIDTLMAYDRNTGQRLSGEAYQQALKSCSALGASVQGNTAARDASGQAAVAFLRKAFGL
ncbi:MAG: dienelactone hydrolase family protein [Rhodocyclaceae bacterium]